MNDLISLINLPGTPSNPKDYVLMLFYSFVLSILLVLAYRKYTSSKTLSYDRSFAATLVMISVIVTGIITTLGTNIVLSLGLIGSLSIIRFRSAIKNPVDLAFLFWAIAIGLTIGSGNVLIGLITSIFLWGVTLFLEYFTLFLPIENKIHILITGDSKLEENKVYDKLLGVIKKDKIHTRSILKAKDGTELIIEVKDCPDRVRMSLATDIEKVKGVKSISIVHPKTLLEQ